MINYSISIDIVSIEYLVVDLLLLVFRGFGRTPRDIFFQGFKRCPILAHNLPRLEHGPYD